MQRLSWANRVTLARITLVLPFVLLFIDLADSPQRWKRLTLLALFTVVALTDMLDGYLARRLHQVTRLGRLLDPLADKLLVLSSMILLVTRGLPIRPGESAAGSIFLPGWVLAAALTKDVVVVLGCYLVYRRTGQVVVNPRLTGKITTFLQMLMVVIFLARPELPDAPDFPRIAATLAGAFALTAVLDYTMVWLREYRRLGPSADDAVR